MTTSRRWLALALTFVLVPALGACNRDAAVETDETVPPAAETTPGGQTARVAEVDLGRSVGPDGRINDGATSDEFRPSDTIYASVRTEGAAGGTLSARWTYEDGQVVDETSQPIAAGGPAVTEFHISKPDGFPTGKYRVEIRLNGQTAETKEFEVK